MSAFLVLKSIAACKNLFQIKHWTGLYSDSHPICLSGMLPLTKWWTLFILFQENCPWFILELSLADISKGVFEWRVFWA